MQTKGALNIATYIYAQGHKSNLKINKLLYICFGFYGATYGKFLFNDKIEAWQYGPVIPSVYHAFNNGYFDNNTDFLLKDKQKDSIDKVLSIYGTKAPFLLVDLTHQQNTPWSNAYVSEKKHIQIEKQAIIDYYKNFIRLSNRLVKEIASDDFKKVMIELSKT